MEGVKLYSHGLREKRFQEKSERKKNGGKKIRKILKMLKGTLIKFRKMISNYESLKVSVNFSTLLEFSLVLRPEFLGPKNNDSRF